MAGSAAAAAGPQYWVAPTSTSTANNSCATAAYTSVQSAVTAAELYESSHTRAVPTIELCPGTYAEQVTITRSLVLTRAKVAARRGPVVIQLPASVGADQSTGLSATNCQAGDTASQLPQSVIEICAATTGGINTKGVSVSFSHVTVQGNWPTTVCNDSLYGILVEGGASLSLADSIVEQIGAYPLNGCQGGVGVEAGFAPTHQVGHLTMHGDTVQTYQKNGITADGPGSTGLDQRGHRVGGWPDLGHRAKRHPDLARCYRECRRQHDHGQQLHRERGGYPPPGSWCLAVAAPSAGSARTPR